LTRRWPFRENAIGCTSGRDVRSLAGLHRTGKAGVGWSRQWAAKVLDNPLNEEVTQRDVSVVEVRISKESLDAYYNEHPNEPRPE
jgi:hypothetical protein